MKRCWIVSLLVMAACAGRGGPGASGPRGGPLTPAQIAERVMPSIVLIKTQGGLGTGFVVWKDGRIATNLHVIAGAEQASVILADGKEYRDISVLAADRRHDLAIIRVRARDLPALPLGDSDAVKAGERVVAIGHPLGLGNTVSDGLVSAVRRLDPQVTLLQISAPIAPGSSGGPLFNDRGEVIGIATLYTAAGQNLNFGVPVSYLKPLLLAENPVSLADLAKEMEIGLLSGCEPEDMKLTYDSISGAIHVGAPLYNKGDHEGCFKLYEKTALGILRKIRACDGIRGTLLEGMTDANQKQGFSAKAWAMRRAFDRILHAMDEALKKVQDK